MKTEISNAKEPTNNAPMTDERHSDDATRCLLGLSSGAAMAILAASFRAKHG